MRKIFLIGLCLSIYLILQIWCSMFVIRFPYLGIDNEFVQGQWVITDLSPEGSASKLDLQVGDIIQQVDGKPAAEFTILQKWKSIEQAHDLVVLRGDVRHAVELNSKSNIFYDMFPFIEQFICFIMLIVLYTKMSHSKSARLLASVFLFAAQ